MTYAFYCACGWRGDVECHPLKLDVSRCPDCQRTRLEGFRQDYRAKHVSIPQWFHDGMPADWQAQQNAALKAEPDKFEYAGPRRSGREIRVG